MWREHLLLMTLILLAGCGGGEDESAPPQRSEQSEAAQPAPPPDGGSQAGHGADAREIAVPRRDSSPPTATIVLETVSGKALGQASQPPGRQSRETAKLEQPALRATALGRDSDGGIARVRVSLKELISCGGDDERSGFEERRTRYFPPPQIERIRSNPGTRLSTRKSRTLQLTLGRGPCRGARAVAVEGELWAEAINGNGLEAVTPHLHLTWTR